ncbi:MAG: hypothetical protein ABIO55_15815 [Ginsengibacter sp.]
MKKTLSLLLITLLLLVANGYSQDSARTKNDKPGTPGSLRVPDNSSQSQVNIINSNTAPGQTIVTGAPESNKLSNSKGQTIITNSNTNANRVPTSSITIANKPPGVVDSVKNSAIQNGISNASNPIRNK